jgi:tetratricopeptide (TPR) repeat protein
MKRQIPARNLPLLRAARYGLPALIATSVLVCFWPVLDNDFVATWDDGAYFLNNQHYRGLSPTHLRWMFTTLYMSHYQPLSWLTHGVVYALWGMDPRGYHLVNLLFHCANAVLVYWLALALLETHRPGLSGNDAGAHVAAAAGALIFAVHPLRVEAVAWATERQEVLCAFWLLLSVLAYLRMQRAAAGRAWRTWYLASLACFALSLLSKAAGLMLPFVLVVLDAYPLRRFARSAGRLPVLLEKIPYVLVAGAATAVVFYTKGHANPMSLAEHGLVERIMQAGFGLCFYVWKSVAPFRLSPLYLLYTPLNPIEPRYVLSALAVIGLTLLLIVLRHRAPWALAAWACYVVLVAPVLGFAQAGTQITADRYSYLACLPFALLAAAGLHQLACALRAGRMRRWVGYAAGGVVTACLTLLAVATRPQIRVWHDSSTLWNQVVAVEPMNYQARNNRAATRLDSGDADGALADADEALRLRPQYLRAYLTRGNARIAKGDTAGALADFDHFIAVNPRYANAYLVRGELRQSRGDRRGAIADFTVALQLNSRLAEAYFDRGNAYKAAGDLGAAIADYGRFIALHPASAGAYLARGNARQAGGDLRGAIADFTAALQLNPQLVDAHFNRGNARKAAGDLAGAVADYSAALELNPQLAGAYNNRGTTWREQGNLAAALADYDRALRVNPRYTMGYLSRAGARRANGDLAGAMADYAQALQLTPPNDDSRPRIERRLAALRQEIAGRQ